MFDILTQVWRAIQGFLADGIELLHGVFEPVFGDEAWGWAIIALTVIVRVIMIPLAVKQFHSMRAMQTLQPQIKAIQKKYKMDRSMMRSDPERYRATQTKKNEEMSRLYKENNANPAAGCLPLLAQGPIFFALYSVLQNPATLDGRLSKAPFYFFTPDAGLGAANSGLGAIASQTGIAGIALIVMVAASMFVSQKQMMARNTVSKDSGDAQAMQQKVMLYGMPIMMGFFGFNLPIGVLLYWVTTNLWSMGQQAIILREVNETTGVTGESIRKQTVGGDALAATATGTAGNTRRAIGEDAPDPKVGSSTKTVRSARPSLGRTAGKSPMKPKKSGPARNGSKPAPDHLPSRPSRRSQ